MSEQNGNGTGTEVARFAPPRLPWHPVIEEKFGEIGATKETWKALCEAIFPLAQSSDSIVLALSYCKGRNLDPFKKFIHIVPMWNSAAGKMIDTIWPGIGEHRATAFRTGVFAGKDETKWGPDVEVTAGSVKLTVPQWCQITVYRMIQGHRVPFPGPQVWWLETYSQKGGRSRDETPTEKWQRSPHYMLEKCAEAAALRAAFPEELGGMNTAEEMEGKVYNGGDIQAPAGQASQRPPREGVIDVEDEPATETTQTQPAGQGDLLQAEAAEPEPQAYEYVDAVGEAHACEHCGVFADRLQEGLESAQVLVSLDTIWQNNADALAQLREDPDGDPQWAVDLEASYKARQEALKPKPEEKKPAPAPRATRATRTTTTAAAAKPAAQSKAAPKKVVELRDEAGDVVAAHDSIDTWFKDLNTMIANAVVPADVISSNHDAYYQWRGVDMEKADRLWAEAEAKVPAPQEA